jgi:hypothetical protein
MRNTTIQFATAATASARIAQLQAQLGLSLTATPPTIDQSWDLIEQLEAKLAETSSPASTAVAQHAATPTAKVDPLAAKPDSSLFGVARAAAAQREGRTAKPTPTASSGLTGVMRAAAAQEQLNRKSQS